MNKATIYIDPNDDITDILSDVKKVKPKIVALVPPKKSDVFHSSVNIKLIQKTATELGKVIVLVTADPAILKLASSSKVPVAESLKSRPIIPGKNQTLNENTTKESDETTDAAEQNKQAKETEKPEKEQKNEITEDFVSETKPVEEIIESIEADKESEKDSKENTEENDKENNEKTEKKKKKKEKDPFKSNRKRWIIFGIIISIVVIAFLVWALIIAPAVTVLVTIKTTSSNFSENITFTEEENEEKIEDGIFYLHEEKISKEANQTFTATGKKDLGDKAEGGLIAYIQSKDPFSESIPAGTTFTYKGLEYVSKNEASLEWDGTYGGCTEGDTTKGCLRSASIAIEASSPGENYNVSEKSYDWKAPGINISIYNEGPISGGTSNIVTIVQQSDVDSALSKLEQENSSTGKQEILNKLSETTFPIETSFSVKTDDPVSTPAVGEEVKEGVIPSVSTKTSYTMFTIDSVRIEEFIKSRAQISDDRSVYSIGNPFIEYFIESSDGYSAKLKTTYKVGPKVAESDILEKSKGKKIGEVQSLLKSINGVSTVNVKKSVFWVNSIPNDPNKVTVEINIEE